MIHTTAAISLERRLIVVMFLWLIGFHGKALVTRLTISEGYSLPRCLINCLPLQWQLHFLESGSRFQDDAIRRRSKYSIIPHLAITLPCDYLALVLLYLATLPCHYLTLLLPCLYFT